MSIRDYKIVAVTCDGCHRHATDSALELDTKWLQVDVDGIFYNLCPECMEVRTNINAIMDAKEE